MFFLGLVSLWIYLKIVFSQIAMIFYTKVIQKFQNIGNVTSIIVTHEMRTVYDVADRVVMLNEGSIVWEGTPAELDTENNPYIKQFVHKTTDGPIRAGFY